MMGHAGVIQEPLIKKKCNVLAYNDALIHQHALKMAHYTRCTNAIIYSL